MFGPDLIRATAICLVLFAHTFPGGTKFPIFGAFRHFTGVLGVELFFLLSGFLIGGILMGELFAGELNRPGGVFWFWKRRWFRTLPAYFLFLVLYIWQWRFLYGSLPDHLERFTWFGQALITPDPEFFTLSWSLAIEEWFYLLFPLFIWLFVQFAPNRHFALLATIVIFLTVPFVIRYFISPDVNWDGGVRRVTLPRLDAIAYGVLLAWLKQYATRSWNILARLWPAGLLGLLILTIHHCYYGDSAAAYTSQFVFYRVFYFSVVSIVLLLIFPKAVGLGAPGGWFEAVIRKISLWSYSIYLSHVFIIGLIGAAMSHWPWTRGREPIIAFPLIWVFTLAFSAFLYRFYEKPLMDLRDRPLRHWFKRKS